MTTPRKKHTTAASNRSEKLPPPARGSARAPLRWPAWASPGVLVLGALLAYHNSFGGPFIFDDVSNVRTNYKLRQLWPVWDAMWGPLNTGVSGRPVVQLSFALDYAAHGLDVAGYHAANLALHAATALVLYGVLRRTLLSPRLAPRFGERSALLAMLVALVWEVHPLVSDSVTYLSGRTEVLAALFLLLTLYGVIRGIESGRFARAWYAGAVVACVLGTGCKEIMVAAPLLALAYDRLFVADSFSEVFRRRWGLYGLLFASLVLIPVNLHMGNFHRSALVSTDRMSPWEYLKIQSEVLVLYLRLSLWPHPLILDYYGWPTDPPLSRVWPYGLVMLSLLAATVAGLARRAPAAFVGAWFFLILAPTSSVLPLPTEIATERRMYLPLMGVVALVVLGVYRLIERARGRWPAAGRTLYRAAAGAAAAVVVAGAARTVLRNDDYKDPVRLWSDVAARRPTNSRAFDNLAYEFVGRRDDLAKPLFLEAIRLNPANYIGLNNLATIYLREGNEAEAARCLERALRINPDYALAHLNLARIQHAQGRSAEAERSLDRAIELEPARVDHRVVLARVLAAQGRADEAERSAREALRLDANSAAGHDALGLALARGGRWAEAVGAFRTALQHAPGEPEYATHLAWHLAVAGDPSVRNVKEADALATRAVAATAGRDAHALDALALARAADGRFGDAVVAAEGALDAARPSRPALAARIEARLAAYTAARMPDGGTLTFE